MSSTVVQSSLDEAVAALETAMAQLASVDMTLCTDEQVLEGWRRVEAVRRRLEPVDHRFIAEVQARNIAFARGCRSLPLFAKQLLQITAAEAGGRVNAAQTLGPRRALSGEVLAPICPTVAAAQTEGAISARHAQIIVSTIETLPVEIQALHDRRLEAELTDLARVQDPDRLARRARRMAYELDQDGQYNEINHRERTRDITVHRRRDGSMYGTVELTAELAEHLDTTFDSLGAPTPAQDGRKDPRTPGQRRHDALLDALRIAIRSGLMPNIAGVSATILLHMDVDAYGSNTGTATTGHGVTIPVDIAKRWAGPEARGILTLLSKTKGITAYSSIHRIFTEQQRLTMMTRDRGCTFDGCDAPAAWTQAHHLTEFHDTAHTRVDDGALLCGHNHTHFEQLGWRGVMLNGRPHWTPPSWIDPTQTPRRNTMHDSLFDDPDG